MMISERRWCFMDVLKIKPRPHPSFQKSLFKKSCFTSLIVLYSKDHKVGSNSQPRLAKSAQPPTKAAPATRQDLIFLHAFQVSIIGKNSTPLV
jgi:hypothetical protein